MGEPYFKLAPLIKEHNVHVFSSNYALYSGLSARVMSVLNRFSLEIEAYSIDECFMHLHGFEHLGIRDYALEIRFTVKQWVGIPVCVGVAPTKTLAKLANHIAKKHPKANGVCYLSDKLIIDKFLKKIDVGEVSGVRPEVA